MNGTVRNYAFSAANELMRVTNEDETIISSYSYDAAGQRLRKTVGDTDTKYVYNSLNLVASLVNNVLFEYNYLEEDGSIICGTRGAETEKYWYRQDIRGSITNILNSSDAVVRSYTYDAYGNTSAEGTLTNSFAYTGAVIDEETGLYYMNARYYDPETGRFISQDSYRGENESFWHLYAYCDGDPVNSVDPTGHGKAYIFYDNKNFSRQANSERSLMKRRGHTVILYSINSASNFVKKWNSLRGRIEYVSIIFHGGAHALQIGNTVLATSQSLNTGHYKGKVIRTSSLIRKTGIRNVRLLSCNAGHRDHANDNLRKAFYGKINGRGCVYSCDGNVSFYRLGIFYEPRLSGKQDSFKKQLTFNKNRKPTGFYC